MKHFSSLALATVALAALSACNTVSPNKTQLALARSEYETARNNPQTVSLAARELQEADTALQRANRAEADRESTATVNHLAYLAHQRATIAQEIGRQKAFEQNVSEASAARDRIQLEARTREADMARQNAAAAQAQARAAQEQTRNAELRTQNAELRSQDAELRSQDLQTQVKNLNAQATARGLVVTFSEVLFTSGRAELKPGSARNIDKLVAFLQSYPQRTVLIEGFTDSTGEENYNLDLSQQRSASVRNALVSKGVNPSRVATRGYGESYPVADNTSPTGRQLNRRVEIILSNDAETIPAR